MRIYLLISGLDDLDPAAAFLAREHEQLGELEEEIGSLSGASYCCAFQSFFKKLFHPGSVSMEATVGSRASSRGAGLDLRKVKEVSRNFVVLPSHCICFRSIVANSSHPSSDKHFDECQSHCIVLLVQQEPAVIREWREKQVRLDP